MSIESSSGGSGTDYNAMRVTTGSGYTATYDLQMYSSSTWSTYSAGTDMEFVLLETDSTTAEVIHDITRSTTVPTVADAGMLSNYSLKTNVVTADNSLDSTDSSFLSYEVRGYDWANIAQRALTLSFWVRAKKTGTYCVAVLNSGTDRGFIGEYTVSTTNTWEKKTINIAASPSAGTWNYTTGVGARIYFTLSAGTDYQGSTGWNTVSTTKIGTSNQVNASDATNNDFHLSQVQLEVGGSATTFEPIPYQEELRLARQYYRSASYYVPATTAQNLGTIDMIGTPTISGGGSGFTSTGTTADSLIAYQTTGAVQTLTLDAEI